MGLTVVSEMSRPVRRAAERMVWAAAMALEVRRVRVGTDIVWLGAAQRRRRGGNVRCWVCGLCKREGKGSRTQDVFNFHALKLRNIAAATRPRVGVVLREE